MATATHEIKEPEKAEEVKVQNLSEAPTLKPDRKPPDAATWQGGFIQMADSLDAQGMHWLGNFFRVVADPPMVTPEDKPVQSPTHATKTGKG